MTHTSTQTSTSTLTSTVTLTPTATTTPYMALVKTSSAKTVKPLDAILYTLTYTNLGTSPVFNVVLTDNLPPTTAMTYVSGSASNGGVYNVAADTLTWNIPAVAPGASLSLTYQIKAGVLPSGNMTGTLTNKACLSYGGGMVCATNAVTVQGDYVVHLSVYNQAGELIQTLASFETGTPITDFTIQNGVIVTDSQTASFIFNGITLGNWDATSASGGKVTNGTYLIKVDSVDPYGVTSTITKNVIVDITRSTLDVAVYNEAGEIVKHFSEAEIINYFGGGPSAALQPADFNVGEAKLSASTLVESYLPGISTSLTITLGSGRSFTWDGVGDNGSYLTSGTYFLEITSSQQNQPGQQIIMPVRVDNDGSSPVTDVVLAPNPVHLSQTTQAKFLLANPGGQLTEVDVQIYTIAGELVKTLQNQPGTPTLVLWDLTDPQLASGTYLAVLDLHSAKGLMGRKILKVQVIH